MSYFAKILFRCIGFVLGVMAFFYLGVWFIPSESIEFLFCFGLAGLVLLVLLVVAVIRFCYIKLIKQ